MACDHGVIELEILAEGVFFKNSSTDILAMDHHGDVGHKMQCGQKQQVGCCLKE